MFLLFRHSGLWHPERAILQVRVEREAARKGQGHSASRLAHVHNPWLLWPVQYPLSNQICWFRASRLPVTSFISVCLFLNNPYICCSEFKINLCPCENVPYKP